MNDRLKKWKNAGHTGDTDMAIHNCDCPYCEHIKADAEQGMYPEEEDEEE